MKTIKKAAPRGKKQVALKPTLTLKPDVKDVKAGETITVAVDFAGFEGPVALTLEPTKTFRMDLKTLSKPGVVRLKGMRDGTATLVATGGDLKKMVHLHCEGAQLRILAFGYWVRD